MTADHAPLSAEVGRLREDERSALSAVLHATWPEDLWERLKFLEREVEAILAARLAPLLATVEQQAEALGRVEALRAKWAADPDGLPRADGCARELAAALHPDPSEGDDR